MVKESVWSGALNFVLVSMPVEIVPAAQEKKIAFRLLHQKDNAPLQHRCSARRTTFGAAYNNG
jgi:non-homologous end joining protein Ku